MNARVLIASFDRVPAAKGASQHILRNAEILSKHFDVCLATLGTDPVAGYRHRPVHIPERNWLLRGLEFNRRIAEIAERHTFDIYHVRSPFEGLGVPAD